VLHRGFAFPSFSFICNRFGIWVDWIIDASKSTKSTSEQI